MKTLETYEERRAFVEELKKQWKTLWLERIDDKVRAEGISDKDYSQLFIERGAVIMATRKFKSPNFEEIMKKHLNESKTLNNSLCPNPIEGGWGKFIRSAMVVQSTRVKPARRALPVLKEKDDQQMRHRGRGWLHFRK